MIKMTAGFEADIEHSAVLGSSDELELVMKDGIFDLLDIADLIIAYDEQLSICWC